MKSKKLLASCFLHSTSYLLMERPDPDALLARVQHDERTTAQGRLKIFFGAAPGVGKTYAMLSDAREKRAAGVDVVVGIVESHGRAETEALLEGLDVLPCRSVDYHGVTLREFDLDAALQRCPALLLVDELAHTNAPESRHAKRWQDVEELLDAGVDVYTTVNVQHVESLNDVVAQITGVVVRETVPDSVLERADEIELVDLAPEELLQRLREGKVYVPQQAARAVENFFRKGNLIALRELALRRTADRVDEQMRSYRRDRAIAAVWPTHERVLVCVHANALAGRLVRTGRRLATQLRVPWYVVYVETADELRRSEPERDGAVQALRLAEQLGAEVVTLRGENIVDEIVAFARSRNVSRIIVGKSTHSRWREIIFGSKIDTLVRASGEIDVYVISGKTESQSASVARMSEPEINWNGYAVSLGVVVLLTALGFLARNLISAVCRGKHHHGLPHGRDRTGAALRSRAFYSGFVSGSGCIRLLFRAAVFDIGGCEHAVYFDLYRAARRRARRQYAHSSSPAAGGIGTPARAPNVGAVCIEPRSCERARLSTPAACIRPACERNLRQQSDCAAPLRRQQPITAMGSISGWWSEDLDSRMVFVPEQRDEGVAQWVYKHNQLAGAGTNTLPAAQALYLPLVGTQGVVGVLGVKPSEPRRFVVPDQLHLLETFANQMALALERTRLAGEAEQARVQIEAERLRNSLLSTVSHDLRTPLASITGAASTLMDEENMLPATTRSELI